MPFDNGTFSKLYDWLGNKTDIPRKRGDSLNREFENFSDGLTDLKSEIDTLASTTEVGYLDGVTSPIQTQLDGKANLSGATFTGSVDLNAIAATKAVTAVDVFVYDTSKDSDGGAWRKRCQHTSWYNEELNTATRGSRREFPAVAVIVAESNKVTIYDGDDTDLPMWRVEDYTGLTIRAVVAISGQIWIGASTGVVASDYAGDDTGTTTLDYTTSTTPAIVNNSVNDVAVTVLLDASIDPATGLPVPTIAVATAGGLSVIGNNGAVQSVAPISYSNHNYVKNVLIADKEVFVTAWSSGQQHTVAVYDIKTLSFKREYQTYAPLGKIVTPFEFVHGITINKLAYTSSALVLGSNTNPFATDSPVKGVGLIAEDKSDRAKGMSAILSSTYNTGWLPGDIKGAFLADTDDTDMVGSGELVTNGDFATNDDTGWTRTADFGWDFSSGAAAHTGATGGRIRQAITTVSGKRYALQFDLDATGDVSLENTSIGIRNSTHTDFIVSLLSGDLTANAAASRTLYFTATSTTHYVAFYTQDDVSIDNISVKLADADRSVNNKGLIVNGIVTRTAVASGADLVSYSGFSA